MQSYIFSIKKDFVWQKKIQNTIKMYFPSIQSKKSQPKRLGLYLLGYKDSNLE